jgi:hypothetical protein
VHPFIVGVRKIGKAAAFYDSTFGYLLELGIPALS